MNLILNAFFSFDIYLTASLIDNRPICGRTVQIQVSKTKKERVLKLDGKSVELKSDFLFLLSCVSTTFISFRFRLRLHLLQFYIRSQYSHSHYSSSV
jgi:hypothetical protein